MYLSILWVKTPRVLQLENQLNVLWRRGHKLQKSCKTTVAHISFQHLSFLIEYLYAQEMLQYTKFSMNFVSCVTLSGEIFSNFYVKKRKYLGLEHHTWKPWSNFAHIHWETNPWEHKSMNNTAIIERKIALTRDHYLIPISSHLSFLNISRGQVCCMGSPLHQYCTARRHTRGI